MKKKLWKRILLWGLLAAVVAALAILPAVARNRHRSTSSSAVSCTVTKEEIRITLSGGGTLQPQDAVSVKLPDGVEISRYLVRNGDLVATGQAIAELDPLTVLAAVRRVQDSLDILDEQINDLSKNSSVSLTSAAEGRVKAVFAQKESDVRQVILDYGALAILSMDGMMTVSFPCGQDLFPGDPVTVCCPDGKEYPGKVASSLHGTVSVTITDDGPQLDDPVTVCDSEGNILGAGSLQIRSPLRILFPDGIVQSIALKEGQKVRKGSVLVRIRDAGNTQREQLSGKHREYEDLMQELLQMAQTGVIPAPCSGRVSGIDETAATGMSSPISRNIVLLADEDPTETQEQPIVSSELIMVTAVHSDGYVGKSSPVSLDSEDMNILGMFTGLAQTLLLEAPEIPLDLTGAQKLDGSPLEQIQPGDVFVRISFGEGEAAYTRLLYLGRTELTSSIIIPSFQIPDFSAYLATPDADAGLFPTEEGTVASVTPQETMTILLAVDELDILQFRKGMHAAVTLDALSGEVFNGTVTKIAAVGTNSGGSSKFTVTVELPCSPRMLPGMNASVVIDVRSSGPVLTLPAAAISDHGSQSFVYTGYDLKSDSLLSPVTVQTGVSDGELVEILSGLEEGQTVWYIDYQPADNHS